MANANENGNSGPKKSGTNGNGKTTVASGGSIDLSKEKCISIHFSPRHISPEEVEKRLKKAGAFKRSKPEMVIDGFLNEEQVAASELDPTITKMVKKLGKTRLNFSKENGPARETMMTNIVEHKALAVFVGPIKGGVEEEFQLFMKIGNKMAKAGGNGLRMVWM